MNITIVDGFAPTNEQAVATFEQELGCRLPEDYRAFLLEHNGGQPELTVFDMNSSLMPDDQSMIHYFFTLDPASEYYEIRNEIKVYTDETRIPLELLPIACDPGGNIICLGIRGEQRGKVYFWDHEFELEAEEEGDLYYNVSCCGSSFQAFVESLSPESELDAE
ncbi:SMI1/KNR4 family protein [Herpetosiphon llansteffanensis]|uniref:SMI1/KNR4 family protein n=1 Tax=Herpetosiphon llansteffanensis TaxID=2094568 RepID=UPI000D7C817E|nr:SMI1/KNR4 family protein [Herpetosiphon llansteffanensis]